MLASAEFAGWILNGASPGGSRDSRSTRERFAEHERQVMNRTNGIRTAGGKLSVPWPRALGTPPWGAREELEHGAARPGAAYTMRLVRLSTRIALFDVYRDLASFARQGLPALLYIGSPALPRHITLMLPRAGSSSGNGPGPDGPEGDAGLDLYDPATGAVTELAAERFAGRRLGIAGWNVPWLTVQPRH
jgi:hypothetical protein